MSFTPYVVTLMFLALVVLGLALYRKLITMGEDGFIHISETGSKMIPHQIALAHKLDVVERWGKSLTVVTLVAGLLLASIYLSQVWQASLKPIG